MGHFCLMVDRLNILLDSLVIQVLVKENIALYLLAF